MINREADAEERDVPELAVQALSAAHQRAVQAGRTLVAIRNGKLVRINGKIVVVIKPLPPRKRVSQRTKFADR